MKENSDMKELNFNSHEALWQHFQIKILQFSDKIAHFSGIWVFNENLNFLLLKTDTFYKKYLFSQKHNKLGRENFLPVLYEQLKIHNSPSYSEIYNLRFHSVGMRGYSSLQFKT